MRIFGLDISLDHGGVVCLNENGKVEDWCFLTTVKKDAAVDLVHGILLSKRQKDESKDTFRLRRLGEFSRIPLFSTQQESPLLSYFVFEGYSYASQSTSICQIAELTGYLKHLLFTGGGSLRVHDPTSVKLFAANKGNASKKEVAVPALLNFDDFPEALIQRKIIKKKGKTVLSESDWWEEYAGPVTDVADAYFLARMVYRELQVRSGELSLSQLDEGERRIFLRVSKAYPINLLDRPFTKRGERVA